MTALGAMKLVEQGRLALDADIGDVLGYRLRNPHLGCALRCLMAID